MIGYKVVPVELTTEMMEEGLAGWNGNDLSEADLDDMWRRMLAAAPALQDEKPRQYPIGPLTYEKVFKAAGLTNLSDMQAVLDAVESELSASAAPAVQGEPVYLYRRLGLNDFVTCDFTRYIELSGEPNFFDTKILYAAPQLTRSAPTFQLGDHVRKTKGSQWKGRVVGTYSTSLTPEGYAVESDTEKGSVQIYPVGALELVAARRKGGE